MSLSSSRIAAAIVAVCMTLCVVSVVRSAAPPRPLYFGQIIVVGNERTRQNVILRQLPFVPAQVLTEDAVRRGEENLARLGIFETKNGVRPTITLLDNPANPDSEFKDVLVTVRETATGSLTWGVGVSSEDGLFLSVVLSERNLDVTRFPTSLDDLESGNAFRGAGQEFRLELKLAATQLPRVNVTFRDPALSEKASALAEWITTSLDECWTSKAVEPVPSVECCEGQ
jgi:outer membrane protein insertion porin family